MSLREDQSHVDKRHCLEANYRRNGDALPNAAFWYDGIRVTKPDGPDPVYSGKAMAGLIDHIRAGRIRKDETVVFLHTGGTPALFAYADDLELTT